MDCLQNLRKYKQYFFILNAPLVGGPNNVLFIQDGPAKYSAH